MYKRQYLYYAIFLPRNTRATASLLNSYKIPAYALKTGELLHYHLSLISLESLIICISQSEKSYEVNKLIKKIQRENTKEVVNPVFWSDNFISLFPNETRTITATVSIEDLHGEKPIIIIK